MHRHRTILLTGGLMVSLGFGIPATAEEVNDRLANQAARISEGISDGSLTAGEAARLDREQAAITREEQRFLSDGTLSPREERKLVRDENRASRHIYRQKHDAQNQPGAN